MRKTVYDKLAPEVREAIKAAEQEASREYYQERKEYILAVQKKRRQEKPLEYARSMAKHWNKKVAELEAQQKEGAPNV